jgi:hypothetical protein
MLYARSTSFGYILNYNLELKNRINKNFFFLNLLYGKNKTENNILYSNEYIIKKKHVLLRNIPLKLTFVYI